MSARIEQPGAKERPILFSGEMVRAILEGRKTQTRRVCMPMVKWYVQDGRDVRLHEGRHCHFLAGATQPIETLRSPYGQPGDFLWVRERQRVIARSTVRLNGKESTRIRVRYEADGAESGWIDYPERLNGKPVVDKCLSYGGYRESSRLSLEVTGVRVERLRNISEGDAEAEGAEPKEYDTGRVTAVPVCCGRALPSGECCGDPDPHPEPVIDQSYRLGFEHLWDSINAARGYSWESNPWVWVVEFRRVQA